MGKNESGSTLVLVLVAVLVLSLIGLSGLTQSSTEVATARNFLADKTAFFTADSGINFGLNELANTIDPSTVSFERSDASGNLVFKTGRIDESGPQPVMPFLGFKAPPAREMSIEMGSEVGAVATPWQLIVSSDVRNLARGRARKEISTAIVTLSAGY